MPTIRKRGNGQYQAVVRRRGYPDTCKTFNTRREAEMWAAIVESEMARGVFFSRTEAESTTLEDALERYWREIRSKMRNAERDKYQHQRWLAHPLSKRFLASVHGSHLAQYRDERRANGKAENTIRIELAYLSQLFEVCRKEWGMEGLANPVRNIRMPQANQLPCTLATPPIVFEDTHYPSLRSSSRGPMVGMRNELYPAWLVYDSRQPCN